MKVLVASVQSADLRLYDFGIWICWWVLAVSEY